MCVMAIISISQYTFCEFCATLLPRLVLEETASSIHHCYLQPKIHCVPLKTCDYILYNNFNNKCPITIIFGIVSSQSMRHRQMVSIPTSPI